MKKLILSVLVLSLAVAVKAQDIPEKKAGMPGMHQRRMGHPGMDLKALNLTDEQKAQFKSQREDFRKQFEVLKKDDNITVKEWKGKFEALRKDQRSKMQGILTTDQKAQLEKMKAEGIAKRQAKGKEMAEKMKAKLGLSDEQSAKLKQYHTDMADKMKALREDQTMDPEKKREQMRELRTSQREQMKSILTEEQLKKLQDLRKEHTERKKVI